MSTQIVDNFKVNVAKPIDSRMVTNGQADRDSLLYKYEGLRVYDLVDQKAYVYINAAWKEESGSGSGSGSGSTTNTGILTGDQYRIPRFTSANTIGSSAILDASTSLTSPKIGIGTPPDSAYAVKVKGVVYASNGFSGIGSELTELNGNNIKPKSIPHDRILAGTNGSILKSVGDSVVWVPEINTSLKITKEALSVSTHYLLFSESYNSDDASVKANYFDPNRYIGIKPSTSQILASGDILNDKTLPTYTFMNNTNSGLFGSTTKAGLSFNGNSLLEIDKNKLTLSDTANVVLSTTSSAVVFGTGTLNNPLIKSQTAGSATLPDYTWVGDVTTGMYRSANNEVSLTTNGANRVKISNSTTTISNAASLSSTLTVSGATTLSSTLLVTGAVTFNSSLSVSGTSNLATTNFSGAATFNSTFKLTSGSPGASKILTSDASGGGTWQNPPAGVPIGTIVLWWGYGDTSTSTPPPDGWIMCWGYTVSQSEYPLLYAQLIATSGVAKVPDLRGYFVVGGSNVANYGQGAAGSYDYRLGKTGGAETVTLNYLQIPKHTHQITDPGHCHSYYYTPASGCGYSGGGNRRIDQETSTNSGSSYTGISINAGDTRTPANGICGPGGASGNTQAHENRPPYMAINYIIKGR